MGYFPSAMTTNAITNGLHAAALLTYAVLSLIFYLKKSQNFSRFIVVILFFLLFIEKCLGVYVHETKGVHIDTWTIMAILSIALNILVSFALEMPRAARFAILLTTLLLNGRFIYGFWVIDQGLKEESFAYLAASALIAFSIAAYYSKGLTRLGWVLIVISNLAWMLMRTGLGYYLGVDLEDYPEYKYDNDIYHLMLIVSTFVLFHSIQKGDWIYPKTHP